MERRDWSLKALKELVYADSLDPEEKAEALVSWHSKYLTENQIEDFDLELSDLKKLEELFFKNIKFLKTHKENTRRELARIQKMKKFLNN